MNVEMWLLMLVPLVVFVVAEMRWGVKVGAMTAVALALLLAIYWYFRFGSIDETLLIEAGLMAVLGIVTVRMRDARYIKFQPVVMAAILAAYCGYFQMIGTPILIRWWPTMVPLAPQLEWMTRDARAQQCLAEGSMWLIWGFVAHGLLVAFAALRATSLWWLVARMAIFPIMVVPALALRVCLSSR